MRVLVTGGSGLLGRRTIAALAARGHDVVALQRHRTDALACEQVLADVRDADAVAAAAAGCDAVIHGAAKVGVVGTREEFRDGQRRWHRGRRCGLPGCPRAATRRRLLAVRRLRVDADRGCGSGHADHRAQRSLLVLGVEGRGRARRAGGERRRPRGDRDPPARDLGTGGHAARRPHRRACPRRAAVRRRRRQSADRHDLRGQRRRRARRCGRAARRPTGRSPAARSSSRTASLSRSAASCEQICAAAGVPPPARDLPLGLARGMAAVAERLWARARPGDEPPATRFLVDQLALAHWFDPRPFRDATGWRPEVTIAEGMRRLAAFYRGEQAPERFGRPESGDGVE